MVSISSDIGQRESEEDFHTLAEVSSSGMLMIQDGQIVYANPAASAIAGYSLAELVGMSILDLLPAESREVFLKRRSMRAQGESVPKRLEIKFLTKSQEERWLDCSVDFMTLQAKPTLIANVIDITERKQAEAALLESESVLRSFFDSAGAMRGIVELEENDILHISDNAITAALFGQTKESMRNKRASELGVPPEILRLWIGHYLKSRQTNEAVSFEYLHNSLQGERWLSVTVSCLGTALEQHPRFAYVGVDVTDRKRVEQEMRVLLHREQAARFEAEVVRDANFALTKNLSLEMVLETLLEHLGKLIPYDSANVMLLEGESKFVVRAIWGYESFQDAATVRALSFDAKTHRPLQRLSTTQQSVVVTDTATEPTWERVPGTEPVRNWLGVPLIVHDRVIGLYSMDKTEPGFFTSEHVRLAETLAAQAASAVQNAQSFQQRRHYAAELEKRIAERKLAEDAFTESRRYLQALFDNSLGGILVTNNEGRYIDANPAACAMLGYTHEELMQLSFLDLTPAPYREEGLAMWQQFLAKGSQSGEYSTHRKDGTVVQLEFRAVANFLPGVHVASSRDVTEHKLAEDRLRQSESELAEAQRIAHIGSWSWDLNSETQFWSDELYRIYGLQPGKVAPTYEAFLELVHLEDRTRLEHVLARSTTTREPIDLHFRITRPDGEERIIHSQGRILYDDQGTPIRKVGTAQDVTEHWRAQEALREVEKKYRDIFENAVEGIFQSTPNGQFITVNPAYACMLGYDSPEELLRSRTDIARQHYVEPERRSEFKQLLEECGVVREFEHRAYCKDGRKIWLSENVRTVCDVNGVVLYYEGFTEDITARKHGEESLRLFRNLIDRSTDAIEVLDPTTLRFLDCNASAHEILGYTREEFLSLSAFDIDPIIDQAMSARLVHEMEKSSFVIFESVHRRKDGSTFPVEINAKTIRLERDYRLAVVRDITERKLAEEALVESDRRFRDLFYDAPVGYHELDTEGRITCVNTTELLMLGYSSEEMIGHYAWEFIVDEEISRQAVADKLAGIKPLRGFERAFRRKDGTSFYGQVDERLLHDPAGRIIGIRTTVQDITERKQIEEELRESEERYRDLVENSRECICTHDLEGRILFANQASSQLWGYPPSEIAGKKISELLAPEVRDQFDAYLAEIRAHGIASGLGLIQTSTGERRVWEYRSTLRSEGPGAPLVRSIARDITERKRSEEALRESEARFRQLSEAAFEAIILHDDGTILEVNQSFCRMYGYERAEVIGKSVLDLTLPEFREPLLQRVRSRGASPFEGLALRKDGTIFRAELAAKPIQYQGRVVRVAAIRDITEQKRNERRQAAQYAVTRVLAEAATLAEATPQLLQVICESLRWKMGEFWRVCDSTNLLRCVETWHVPGLDATAFIEASRQTELAPGAGLPGRVWQSGQPAWIPDVLTDPRFARAAIAAKVGLRGAVAFPILLGNHTLGVMLFFSRRAPEVDEDLLKIMSAIGSQIGQFTERKRAEEALLASERRYRDIFAFAPVGIYQSWRDGTLITANKALAKMLGYASVDELLRVKLGSGMYLSEDEREKLIREYEGLGYAVDVDMQWKRKDGSPICVQLSAQAIKGPNGETEYFEGFVRDITERKRAEESLRKQNEYLAALHETALGLINRLDLDELLEDIVTRACALVDIPSGYVYLIEPGGTEMSVKVGVGVSRDFVGARISQGQGVAGRIWQTGQPLVVDDYRNWEHRLTNPGYDDLRLVGAVPLRSGSQVVGVLGVESTEDGQGLGEHQIEILNRFAQLASIALDNAQLHSAVQQELAERKRAGEELRASEERYRELFEQASDVIFKTDARGNWGSFNPAAVKLLKYGEKELTGKYYLDLVKPEYRSAVKGFYQEQFRTKTPNTRYEFPAIAKDGTEVWIEQRATLLFENDQAAGLHLVARDITERKRAEAALRESEERYRDLVENSQEFICTHDLNGLILSANRAASEVLGYDLKDYCGKKNYRDLLVPEVRDQFDDYLARLRRDGVASGLTLVQTSSGERRILEYHNTVRTEGVATPIVRGMARDITEQRRAEKAMSVLRHELELTMNTMAEGVHRVDLKGNIVFENPAAARMLGWEVAELLGKPAHLTMHHTRQDGTPYPKEECPIYATFRDGVSRHVADEVFWRRDGTSFPVEYMTAPMRNDRDEIVAAVVTFRDITERKRAEAALRQSEERFSKAFHSSPAALSITLLENGKLLEVNEAFLRMTGYKRAEAIGRSTLELGLWFDSNQRIAMDGILRERGTVRDLEFVFRQKSGEVRNGLLSVDLIELSGKPCVLGIAQDVTERNRAEEALQSYPRQLIEAQEAERQRIARELHDQIGQVLTAIHLNLASVWETCESSEARALIDEGVAIVDGALEQVRDLSFELRPSLLDDLGLATALRWYADRFAQRTGIHATTVIDLPESPIRLTRELETACFRIVQEALTNVVRHARARKVSITLKSLGAKILLTIKDDGIGFDANSQNLAAFTGSLGLRGMRERALALGGRLEVRSSPSRGTEIRAHFPSESAKELAQSSVDKSR